MNKAAELTTVMYLGEADEPAISNIIGGIMLVVTENFASAEYLVYGFLLLLLVKPQLESAFSNMIC